MGTVLQLLEGALARVAVIVLARRAGPGPALRRYAGAVSLAALIYVGFTIRGAPLRWLVVELAGLAAFTLLAWLGLKFLTLLALGWAAHALWDTVLHKYFDA